jgi:serine protease Do
MNALRKNWWWTGTAVAVAIGLIGLVGVPAFSDNGQRHEPKRESTLKKEMMEAKEVSNAIADVAAEVKPAVVNIKVVRKTSASSNTEEWFENSPFGGEFFRHFFNTPRSEERFHMPGKERHNFRPHEFRQSGAGSGVVVDANGHILTNNHVVDGANQITVRTSDGKEYDAKVIGTDPRTDLAVIRVEKASLPQAQLGDSNAIRVGETVIAIGNPFGLEETVTSGIVSAKGRSNLRIAEYEDWIQTDAAINPGNSGGPLVDLDGKVVGINSAIFSGSGANEGIGFAVPINMARSVMDQIIEHGKVTRSYMGVMIQPLSAELAESFGLKDTHGALVGEVKPNSPAAQAGFQTGDIVRRYDGKEIMDAGQLKLMVASTPPGKSVEVEVMRNRQPTTLTVKPAEQPEDMVAAATGGKEATTESWGLTVQALTPEIAKELGYEGDTGVVITEVEPGTLAAEAGLQQGNLIVQVNHHKIASLADFNKEMSATAKNQKALLLVKSGKEGTRFVVLSRE